MGTNGAAFCSLGRKIPAGKAESWSKFFGLYPWMDVKLLRYWIAEGILRNVLVNAGDYVESRTGRGAIAVGRFTLIVCTSDRLILTQLRRSLIKGLVASLDS